MKFYYLGPLCTIIANVDHDHVTITVTDSISWITCFEIIFSQEYRVFIMKTTEQSKLK